MRIKTFNTEIVPFLTKIGFKKYKPNDIDLYDNNTVSQKWTNDDLFEMVLKIKLFNLIGYVVINHSKIEIQCNGEIISQKRTNFKNHNDIIGYLYELPLTWSNLKIKKKNKRVDYSSIP